MYGIIKKHLIKNWFERVQGNGYITINKINSSSLSKVIRDLYRENNWLGYFTRDIKRTIVNDETHSYDKILQYYKDKYNKDKNQNWIEIKLGG